MKEDGRLACASQDPLSLLIVTKKAPPDSSVPGIVRFPARIRSGALSAANYIGFTGTPIAKSDANTRTVWEMVNFRMSN